MKRDHLINVEGKTFDQICGIPPERGTEIRRHIEEAIKYNLHDFRPQFILQEVLKEEFTEAELIFATYSVGYVFAMMKYGPGGIAA